MGRYSVNINCRNRSTNAKCLGGSCHSNLTRIEYSTVTGFKGEDGSPTLFSIEVGRFDLSLGNVELVIGADQNKLSVDTVFMGQLLLHFNQ